MRTLLMLAVLVVACSPPPPPPTMCDRFVVDALGFPSNGFAGGFVAGGFGGSFGGGSFAGGLGGGGGSFGPSFPVTGEVATMRMFAPLTTCPEDEVRSSVEVIGPDNLPVAATITAPRSSTSNTSIVSSDITFPTELPGTYVVRGIFEPSLGVRTATRVAIGSNVSRGVEVPLGGFECERPWPLTAGSVACELNDATVLVLSADAGQVRFPGSELVVAGDALWSRRSSVLERREWADATGAQLTHSFNGFTGTSVRGEHTRDSAIRNLGNGNFAQASTDGGVWEFSWAGGAILDGVIVRDGDEIRTFSSSGCSDPCVSYVVALSPDLVWLNDFNGGAAGFPRPYTSFISSSPPRTRITFPIRVEPPNGGFVVWPLWIDADDGSSVLISTRGSDTRWTSWPRDRVLKVGADFVVLKGLPNRDALVVVPLWP